MGSVISAENARDTVEMASIVFGGRERIEETPAIVFRPHTAIMAFEGGDHLERVRWRDDES